MVLGPRNVWLCRRPEYTRSSYYTYLGYSSPDPAYDRTWDGWVGEWVPWSPFDKKGSESKG